MRLIDADSFIESITDFDLPGDTIDSISLRILLMETPTVDAVSVVRCKDCEYWWQANELCTHEKHRDGNVCCHECRADNYCSDGKIRE